MKLSLVLGLTVCVIHFLLAGDSSDSYADYVNPLVGSDSDASYSTGNTYPAIAVPWGMNFWTPQTNTMGNGWCYQYDARVIRGFKQTHQPSPWIGDYAAFSFMPVVGTLEFDQHKRGSVFSHKTEIARPYYYHVYLADHDVTTEITPTERAAQFRFTFPESEESYILLDAFNGGSEVRVDLKNSDHAGPIGSVGRKGVDHYNKLGYIPSNVGVNESVARSLEYSYADYTIWKLAEALKMPQNEIDTFRNRAQNYRNVFDPEVNFMRGKNKDGRWTTPFIAEKWGGDFTEGNAWHYTWSVFQDPQGLIDMMGGAPAFNKKLDAVFTTPPHYEASYYGRRIHEILEMQVANMGQYAHGNQPIQHMIYLYNYSAQPWKSQYWLREVMDKLYSPTPDGLCGDEDNGQTSAWYVFSALGFYPVCPGSGEYVLGSPLFKEALIHLQNGKTFTISAPENSSERRYIQSAHFNGMNYSRNYVTHAHLMKGGELKFKMTEHPNKTRGTGPDDVPYSMSRPQKNK